MIFKQLRANIDVDDDTFNELYPNRIKKLSSRHWTPVVVAKMAAEYLAKKPNIKVLDIGSGAGKFCLVGAACTQGMFYGIEQRDYLIEISKKIAAKYHLPNIEFINSNINKINFCDYEAFYFFNSFYENVDTSCPIDNIILPSNDLFYAYSNYVKQQLQSTAVGTRLVTYCTDSDNIPNSFSLSHSAYYGFLKFWDKVL
ncbi:class I SAM-dependent methyltransferase [Dyadobacter frigoris]|uniref:Methyltransferase domain-containing protein n=1 Tax=Dyadobacter frigoris TaxID=2576211 RepID=A0A4U6D8P0_9BACT|nr:class I SAM-dependent methyltransferase [Dyadobacter frigoris]TKT92468.1 methyltransferase domain-containing protein [Dyadobacter frigoris]GLU55258.1 hypothetical protein Dfri01_47190 [Dyadobacter frigoris]